MDSIVQHPATTALSNDIRPRSRLKEKHQYLFGGSGASNTNSAIPLFDELGLVACSTGVVCRKEFLETYAAATYIHSKFPQMNRIADLAAGHGLLAWFLLALDHNECDSNVNPNHNSTTTTKRKKRTVICVDRRMPSSADVIANAMIHRFPELEGRWSYVQSDLSAIVPHPSCLLTSVHACGTLTDYLIEITIGSGAPLAIVPCCHTVKERMGYRPHALSGMDAQEVIALVEERKKKQMNAKHEAVADVVDEVRCRTLRNTGYDVEEVMLPEMFTARNRLLLAQPTAAITTANRTTGELNHRNRAFFQRQKQGGSISSSSFIHIPLADDPESIAHCNAVAGRAHAAMQVTEQIPRRLSFTLAMSIWLGSGSGAMASLDNSDLTVETLQTFADQSCQRIKTEPIQCTVKTSGNVHLQSSTGRRWQLYKCRYTRLDGSKITAISRINAKTIHSILRERIGDECEGLLR